MILLLSFLACGAQAPVPATPALATLGAGPGSAQSPLPSLGGGASSLSEKNPFSVQVESLQVQTGGSASARLTLKVPQGTYLYKDMCFVEVVDAGGLDIGTPDLPPGLMRFDEAMGVDREMWEMDAVIELPLNATAPAGTTTVLLNVGYQGCRGGLCFMPKTEQVSLQVSVTP